MAGVEIGGQGDVTLGGHRVRHLADPVHQTIPFVNEDQGGEGARPLGDGQVSEGGLIASEVGDRLARQRASVTENRRWQNAIGRRGLCGWRVPGAGGPRDGNRQSERQPVPCHALCGR